MEKKETVKNSPFKSIIVGVDFSAYSKIVVKQALLLAKQMNAKLALVHAAFDNSWQGVPTRYYVPSVSLPELKNSIEKFYQLKPSDTIVFQVRRGVPTDVVLKVAHDMPAPLIIVGSQGGGAISRFILGSHAEQIALRSSYPVWVHRGRKIFSFKKVLVPTDLSVSSHKLISKMKKWSEQLKMSMNYVYIRPEVPANVNSSEYKLMKDRIQKNVKTAVSQFHERDAKTPLITMTANDPSKKISSVGKKYDVIAMNPHWRSGLLQKFGRTTSRVIRLSDNPVLVVKS